MSYILRRVLLFTSHIRWEKKKKRKEKDVRHYVLLSWGGNIRIDTIAALYQQHTCKKTPASQKVEEKRHFACCKVDTETSKFMVVIKQRRRRKTKKQVDTHCV